jgi:hypothetical protein
MASIKLVVKQADQQDVYRDIIRIQEHYRRTPGGAPVKEGEVCKVVADQTGRSAIVILRGRHGANEASVWMDERTRQALGASVGEELLLRLEPRVWFGTWRWAMGSSDIAYRISAQLALLSVLLGVVGLLLGIWSSIK